MFARIVAAVDLSDRSQRIVESIPDLADPDRSEIVLLHVIETIDGVPDEELEDFFASLRERAETRLADWARELEGRAHKISTVTMTGKRAPRIIRYASEVDADLLILGSHRVDQERPGGGLGTISHQVALLAHCPVLLIR